MNLPFTTWVCPKCGKRFGVLTTHAIKAPTCPDCKIAAVREQAQ